MEPSVVVAPICRSPAETVVPPVQLFDALCRINEPDPILVRLPMPVIAPRMEGAFAPVSNVAPLEPSEKARADPRMNDDVN